MHGENLKLNSVHFKCTEMFQFYINKYTDRKGCMRHAPFSPANIKAAFS